MKYPASKSASILFFFTFLFLVCGCDSAEYAPETDVRSGKESSAEHADDPILGNYFVNNFEDYKTKGIVLMPFKPKKTGLLYEFCFLPNGKITFTDLNGMRKSSTGILSVQATWNRMEDNLYTLEFRGEYSLSSKFEAQVVYELSEDKHYNKILLPKEIVSFYEKSLYND